MKTICIILATALFAGCAGNAPPSFYYRVDSSTFESLVISNPLDSRIDPDVEYFFVDNFRSLSAKDGYTYISRDFLNNRISFLKGIMFRNDYYPFYSMAGSRWRFMIKMVDLNQYLKMVREDIPD